VNSYQFPANGYLTKPVKMHEIESVEKSRDDFRQTNAK
jgi:hypothetical protein